MSEAFTPDERAALEPYVTNLDGPLFARYSRSPKSLRRLFLDEFAQGRASVVAPATGSERAEQLYERVFFEYGDDSVAQLGGVHLACEGA